ncbi:DUF4150 domain-containing protein [Mesorhizobium sp. B2-6-7]|uniref:DUF4150 domain-containing protein n=1 Tax=unclassified Mesorhizobium TaxID=325217 RepID=UPI001129AD95|nr:DUF4150 domain-containing protein [Mesorhizobium sp. B2-6-7]TPI52085.1 DUF4150 domain-containing protein [Mesorhizobium sp. B3-1-1]TPJ83467.1 DUF4150 domain-containing protein [Mesorhizobium sp. B2-6-3]TPJ97527.1 DUF4150 domain-containing protein [Mesorhizobium sp. B2-5-10]TPK07276.1 DUF4150 domain-containing protein [Mesorhizobium sp. B2-5-11]TPK30241.1 DUF4150 domain-containing protein [Mesorhizobium sp. B2-5-8]
MPCTVFAENMGWFHKGSNGQAIAPGDVCLTPPPPPAGPVPVPYVNMAFAKDLIKGSKSVKADGGNPTALENVSECSMSTGNEPATPGLGAGVVTHKIKGKASFTLWSFTVKVEGKGVCRHGDPVLQNTMCTPPNCTTLGALTTLRAELGDLYNTPCPKNKPYSQACRPGRSAEQRNAVNGKPCWECKGKRATGTAPFHREKRGRRKSKKQWTKNADGSWEKKEYRTHDHQPPLNEAWDKGGCHLGVEKFKEMMRKAKFARPHCEEHYMSQGSKVKAKVARSRR